jgi:hypothetical protein
VFEYAGVRTILMRDPTDEVDHEPVPSLNLEAGMEMFTGEDEIADGLGESHVSILVNRSDGKGVAITVLPDGRKVARAVEMWEWERV